MILHPVIQPLTKAKSDFESYKASPHDDNKLSILEKISKPAALPITVSPNPESPLAKSTQHETDSAGANLNQSNTDQTKAGFKKVNQH